MRSDGKCPFVTEDGCSIYGNRPTSCRLYPLARVRAGDEVQYYLLVEDFCRGHLESREWDVHEWIKDQQVEEYNNMNDLFFQLIAAKERCGRDLSKVEVERVYSLCFDTDRLKLETGIEDDKKAMVEGIKLATRIVKKH